MTAPVTDDVDAKVRDQMVGLVGDARMAEFESMLLRRLDGLGDLAPCGRGDPDALAELHKAVSESGMLGFARLSGALRALEHAAKAGADPSEALIGARTAVAGVRAVMAGRP